MSVPARQLDSTGQEVLREVSGVDWSLTRRRDRALDGPIAAAVRPGERVLDLGCGSGDLLWRLKREKGISERGIEIDGQAVTEAISRGLSVVQGELHDELVHTKGGSFDLVILNQVLTVVRDPVSVLVQALRVAGRVAVTFPNFAFHRTRSSLALRGRLPVTPSLPYQWYDTPNIRLVTVKDFRNLCGEMGFKVLSEAFVRLDAAGRPRPVRYWPNMRASSALFVLGGKGREGSG